MSRVRDLASILTASSSMATDAEVSAVSAQIPANVAGKNKIINGDFGVWQRGTSFTTTNTFTADRYLLVRGLTGTATISQQSFSPGTAPVAGYASRYFLRYASVDALDPRIIQRIEDVGTFAGQTVTVSFYAKSDTSDAFADTLPTVESGFQQHFGTGGSSIVSVGLPTASITLTSSWTRYALSVAIPDISGKTIGANSNLRFTLAFKTEATFDLDIWGLQIEAGSVATPFTTASGTIGGELALCQRYYYRAAANTISQSFGAGQCFSATSGRVLVSFPVKMRTAPTGLEQSGTAADYIVRNAAGTGVVLSAVPTHTGLTTSQLSEVLFSVASGLVAGNATILYSANTSAYLGWSAEI